MLSIAVAIATQGRRELLTQTLRQLESQTRPPDRLVVCSPSDADVDGEALSRLSFQATALLGRRGLTTQRNRILSELGGTDLVVFFDDDFFPANNYLERAEILFEARRAIIVATGQVLADGARTAGISPEAARERLARLEPGSPADVKSVYSAYGCNMAVRLAAAFENKLYFDEALPGYGWLEDLDFSRRASRFGEVVRDPALQGVHLGVKSGRASGVRFGYSQVANPYYLFRKRSITADVLLSFSLRNILANLVRTMRPEPFVDRKGRLRGNMLAALDLLRGKIDPMAIEDM
jgi:succinoglycan biosynthesis transport protein ExoP